MAKKKAKAKARQVRGNRCWEIYPLSEDPDDPPGTRIVRGEKYKPSLDPTDPPCTMVAPDGSKWENIRPEVPDVNKDPETASLANFPRWNVFYKQEVSAGGFIVKKWIPDPKDGSAKPGGGYVFMRMRTEIAIKWVQEAEKFASTPSRKAWVARLKKEFGALVLQERCSVNCWPAFYQLYLIANAAQYLAEMWSRGEATIPYVKYVSKADEAWRPVEEVLEGKTGAYLGALLAGAAVLIFLTKVKK